MVHNPLGILVEQNHRLQARAEIFNAEFTPDPCACSCAHLMRPLWLLE